MAWYLLYCNEDHLDEDGVGDLLVVNNTDWGNDVTTRVTIGVRTLRYYKAQVEELWAQWLNENDLSWKDYPLEGFPALGCHLYLWVPGWMNGPNYSADFQTVEQLLLEEEQEEEQATDQIGQQECVGDDVTEARAEAH